MIYLILAIQSACRASLLQFLNRLSYINFMQTFSHYLFLHIHSTTFVIFQSSPLLFLPQFFLTSSLLLYIHLPPHLTQITIISLQYLTCNRFSILSIEIFVQGLLSTIFTRQKFRQRCIVRRLMSCIQLLQLPHLIFVNECNRTYILSSPFSSSRFLRESHTIPSNTDVNYQHNFINIHINRKCIIRCHHLNIIILSSLQLCCFSRFIRMINRTIQSISQSLDRLNISRKNQNLFICFKLL